MGLIYRTSSLANIGASSIKNAELTYEEGDGNIAFLLTNLSGSNVSIQGNTTIDGPIQLNGNLQADGIIYASNLTSASQNYTVTYDTGSGRLYYTASSAILGAAPTLQQVTDKGKITTNNIEILGQAIIGNQGINLYAGTNGFSGTPARVYIYDDTFGDSQTISITNTVYSSSGYTLSISRPLLGSSYSLTYPTTGGFFAVSVNSTASNAAGNITITTVPTASFVTASNVFGPYGSSSVLSSSFAISASWAPFVATNTGSLLVTASVASNTITFTKGDGSTFPISVNTGSAVTTPTASLLVTASATNNTITFTKGNGDVFNVTIATGSATPTGSLLTTASISLNTITFTKGDGSTFPITVNTGSVDLSGYTTNTTFNSFTSSYKTDSSSFDQRSQIVIPSFGSTNAGGIFAQNTNNPVIGTNNIVYVRQTTTLVTQNTTGTQTIYQIPWWTGTSRDLSRGSNNFRYINVTSGTTVTTSSLQLTGSFNLSGSAFVTGLTSASQTNVLTYNSSTGQVFFTASSAIGGGTTNTGSFTGLH